MHLTPKQHLVLKWTARILALGMLLFALPFYFGYGNPLPFANPANSLLDNVWLLIIPVVFVGLVLGWKYEKIAGYLITIPIAIAMALSLILIDEVPGPMFAPFVIGILYLFVGCRKKELKNKIED